MGKWNLCRSMCSVGGLTHVVGSCRWLLVRTVCGMKRTVCGVKRTACGVRRAVDALCAPLTVRRAARAAPSQVGEPRHQAEPKYGTFEPNRCRWKKRFPDALSSLATCRATLANNPPFLTSQLLLDQKLPFRVLKWCSRWGEPRSVVTQSWKLFFRISIFYTNFLPRSCRRSTIFSYFMVLNKKCDARYFLSLVPSIIIFMPL